MSAYIGHMALQRGMDLLQRDRALRRRGVDPLAPRLISRKSEMRPDMNVPYDALVAGVVDRAEWAKFIGELLDETPRRNKAALARRIDFRERTLDRWLRGEVDVADASVRQVAEKTGRKPMELLIRVGIYSRDELPPPTIAPEDEWIVRLIQASAMDPTKKAMMIAVELAAAKREREEKARRLQEQINIIAGPDDDGR